MTALALHFPWRRYHATPWGRYVNEGAVEIPPSPWRLLRALYSVWKLRAPDLDEDTVHALLGHLAQPPTYVLPPYQLSHTRHYLPDTRHRSGAASTDLSLDAFAVLGGDATIHVIWPGDLTPIQDKTLDRLACSLPYLGRADSLCDARVERGWAPASDRLAVPLDLGEDSREGPAAASLLAAQLPLDITSLIQQPTQIRAARLLYPPASRLVPYTLPQPERPRSRPRRTTQTRRTPTTAVRLSLAGTPQPRAQDLVTVTDTLRAACVKALTGIRGGTSAASLLAGKDSDGRPLEGHQHAHFLAITGTGYIDGLAIWAPGGLCSDELEALARLAGRTIGAPEGVPGPRGLHVRLSAHGGEELLPPTMTGPATSWVSATPFVPSRHRKRHQDTHAYLSAEIGRELRFRDITTPVKVTQLSQPEWALYTRHRWTQRNRRQADYPGNRAEERSPFGLRLEFARPTGGPLTLGTLSHFGLGLFRPEDT